MAALLREPMAAPLEIIAAMARQSLRHAQRMATTCSSSVYSHGRHIRRLLRRRSRPFDIDDFDVKVDGQYYEDAPPAGHERHNAAARHAAGQPARAAANSGAHRRQQASRALRMHIIISLHAVPRVAQKRLFASHTLAHGRHTAQPAAAPASSLAAVAGRGQFAATPSSHRPFYHHYRRCRMLSARDGA